MKAKKIRNFCIIAHIDHGKSTLADRLLELTGTVEPRQMQAQFLDRLSLEREKGITIKLKAVRMVYESKKEKGKEQKDEVYELNLIDTPGHVDFSYEVSRSLAACEGALVVVDATQGIQAQTLSHVNRAKESGLTLIPIINKVDLANAQVAAVKKALVETFGFKEADMLEVSAKTGQGVEKVLEAIVDRIPSPLATNQLTTGNLRALVFDSFYDEHKGVVAVVKVVSGRISMGSGERLRFYRTGVEFEPLEVGCFSPDARVLTELSLGEVGYVATGFKDVDQVRVGDTLLEVEPLREVQPLPGYHEPKPMVFAGLYPIDNQDYLKLRQALGKLHLTDSSFTYAPESSPALGNGFRGGFLGLLHAEVVQERLEREFDLDLVSTTPNVVYEVLLTSGKQLTVNCAAELPDPTQIKEIREPWVRLIIYSPSEYIGAVMKLSEEKRALYKEMNYLGSSQTVQLIYEMPLSEMMVDFFDRLKSISAGYASLDWEFLDFRPAEAVRLDVYVHQELVEPLSQIVIKEKADRVGRQLVVKLKEVIPPQQFPVALQAALGGKILARETVPALRKDVTAKLYGGHRERKDKLLEAQKKGKKRMKMFGQVAIPQEAFRAVLSSS